MSKRINPNIPRSPRELEEFYLQAIDKLKGTTATLEEVDQRSGYPGASVSAELERDVRYLADAMAATFRAQIGELEVKVSRLTAIGSTQAAIISELERRIDSLEKSARY